MIDAELVRRLVATQFPQWADLPVCPIPISGWDNRTFHSDFPFLRGLFLIFIQLGAQLEGKKVESFDSAFW